MNLWKEAFPFFVSVRRLSGVGGRQGLLRVMLPKYQPKNSFAWTPGML